MDGFTVWVKSCNTISPHAANKLLTYKWSVEGATLLMARATASAFGNDFDDRGWETPVKENDALCEYIIE